MGCFSDDDQLTDVEEMEEIWGESVAAHELRLANEATARRTKVSQDASRRRAETEAATEAADVDIEDEEDELAPKKKGKGIASLRIDRTSSLGGSPVGSGLSIA